MGNMTCRNIDTTTAHTCASGSPNGASMTYDAEGRMDSWTAPSGTTANDKFLYDNEGKRVLQRTSTTTGGTTTVTDDITFDGFTEVTISGGTTATAKYYSANGQRVAMRVNGLLSYLLSDILGSSTIALNSDGSGQAVQLFSPYGSVNYSWGSMPTTYNFTGQRLDSQTGLLYYIFRYYDSVSGRFVRADTVQNNANGMDPFAYVGDNPETKNDPTGHWGWGATLFTAVTVVAVVAAVVAVAAATPFVAAIATGIFIGYATTTLVSMATEGVPTTDQQWGHLGWEAGAAEVVGGIGGALSTWGQWIAPTLADSTKVWSATAAAKTTALWTGGASGGVSGVLPPLVQNADPFKKRSSSNTLERRSGDPYYSNPSSSSVSSLWTSSSFIAFERRLVSLNSY